MEHRLDFSRTCVSVEQLSRFLVIQRWSRCLEPIRDGSISGEDTTRKIANPRRPKGSFSKSRALFHDLTETDRFALSNKSAHY